MRWRQVILLYVAAGLLDHRGQVASKMVAPSGAIVLELTTDPYRRAEAEAVICLNGGQVAQVRATGATRPKRSTRRKNRVSFSGSISSSDASSRTRGGRNPSAATRSLPPSPRRPPSVCSA